MNTHAGDRPCEAARASGLQRWHARLAAGAARVIVVIVVVGLAMAATGLLGACGVASGPGGPKPFTTLSYADASRAASEQHTLLLVDATASWCPPCQRMERETWPDAQLGAWLATHAIAVQVDVDEQRDLAQQLAIEAMPTLILFHDGVELGRSVGGMDADALLAWLEGLAPPTAAPPRAQAPGAPPAGS